ncbi:MAG: carbohydrate-binding family 9-like protein [Bacteroidales bacterium]|nr:carbohydrate-binding family 9-like protein [Bacteroidales bacterium]
MKIVFHCFCITVIFLFISLHNSKAQLPIAFSEIKSYVVYKTPSNLCIDGKINEAAWQKAKWTDRFVDIEGTQKPLPAYTSRVKMLWDNQFLYFAAYLEEPHIWASLTERESVIFYDNDFEIFIDPDRDTHNYMEFEINALGTEWDLFLCKPYRDACSADNSWNFEGIKSKVHIYGTLNNPNDTDSCWTIEIAIPWKSMIEFSVTKKIPVDKEQWRINFSRVEWDFDVINGVYIRKRNKTGEVLPEHNWVWSPQGVIAMHQPETWGFIQFSDSIAAGNFVEPFIHQPEEDIKWILRQVYYLQKKYYRKNGYFADNLADLQQNIKIFNPQNKQIII